MFAINGFDVFGIYRQSYAPVETIEQAIIWAKETEGFNRVSVRRAVYGEWDCSNFTIAGHINHDTGILERF